MPSKYEAGGPIPESPGRAGDLYREVRQLRLYMEKEVAAVRERESELKRHLIDTLSVSDDTGASGRHVNVRVVTKVKPRIADWTPLTDYIRDTGRFDLLQHRLSERAVMDMLEDGEAVPGVEKVNVKDLSVTKLR